MQQTKQRLEANMIDLHLLTSNSSTFHSLPGKQDKRNEQHLQAVLFPDKPRITYSVSQIADKDYYSFWALSPLVGLTWPMSV